MTIRVDVFGIEEVERSMSLLAKRFPDSAKQAASTAAARAKTEFHDQAVRATGISRRRLTNRTDGLVGQVRPRTVAGTKAYGFRISNKRPGVDAFKTTKFSARAGFSYQNYIGSPRIHVPRAFRIKGKPRLGVFARILFRSGLRASRKGVAPKPSPGGLVHRLPIQRYRGLSMSRLWDNKVKVRDAVTRRGQDELAREVNIRLARLISRGSV
jgi:hypothetical protein